MKNIMSRFIVVALLLVGVSMPSYSKVITLDIEWSGVSFANSATASGFLTFDDTVCVVESLCDFTSFDDFGVTISGANAGNGTFNLSDFSSSSFYSIGALDFGQELIGQLQSNGCSFGTSTGVCGDGEGGDFNMFGATTTDPTGVWYFNFATDGGAGDQMLVTSMIARNNVQVSAPTGLMMLGMGMLAIGFTRKRKTA